MSLIADRESRLLIDGKLVTGSAGTFETVNPATEEVLGGVAANADHADMSAAIGGAARAAFDDSDWSTNTELRVRCLRQLREALQANVEELRELTIAEVGAPRMLTSGAQLEGRSMTWRSAPTPRRATSGAPSSAMRHHRESRPTAPSPGRLSASSVRSLPGTSRTRSISPRWDRRWRPATP